MSKDPLNYTACVLTHFFTNDSLLNNCVTAGPQCKTGPHSYRHKTMAPLLSPPLLPPLLSSPPHLNILLLHFC